MLSRTTALAISASLALVTSCGDDDASPTPDTGGPDRDAGAIDAGADDDAGPLDMGRPYDSGRHDSGPRDAGPPPPRTPLCDPEAPAPGPYPAPEAWPRNRGPGGPRATFTDAQLLESCAFLDGGELDVSDHHNLVTMYDGYLLMPWAPETGMGGLTFWDISDPCNPVVAGTGFSAEMRETHSIGFSQLGGRWAVVNHLHEWFMRDGAGIEFWDLSDTSNPRPVSRLGLEGGVYPDSYSRVTLSVFWQSPYVFVTGSDNGLYVVDAVDPRVPVPLLRYGFEPVLRAGQVQVVGNLLMVSPAEGPRTVLLDVSDPESPQPIPGGDFTVTDATGEPRDSYFSTMSGGYVYYARKESGGGVIVYDIHDPSNPTYAGDIRSDGNGGYVFVHEGVAFVGEGSFATAYDVSNLPDITEIARFHLTGDLDTITPIGNVVVLSVDADANPDQGSAIAPFRATPDSVPPVVTWAWPADGATVPITSRFGVTFSELVDVASAWDGSVRLYETGTDPDVTRVAGVVSTQETIVNFVPRCPLRPATGYTLEIPAGGIVDFTGNPIAEAFTATFTTTE